MTVEELVTQKTRISKILIEISPEGVVTMPDNAISTMHFTEQDPHGVRGIALDISAAHKIVSSGDGRFSGMFHIQTEHGGLKRAFSWERTDAEIEAKLREVIEDRRTARATRSKARVCSSEQNTATAHLRATVQRRSSDILILDEGDLEVPSASKIGPPTSCLTRVQADTEWRPDGVGGSYLDETFVVELRFTDLDTAMEAITRYGQLTQAGGRLG